MSKPQIIYRQNGCGRSGHALKDLFTSVILGQLLDLDVAIDPSWRKQRLVPFGNAKQLLSTCTATHEVHLSDSQSRLWKGVSYEAYQQLATEVRKHQDPDTLLVLQGVVRIHLCQVANWESQGLVPVGNYAALLGTLRDLYWGDATRPQRAKEVRDIVIHARRGDVAKRGRSASSKMGPGNWSAKFYQQVIDSLRKTYPSCTITMLSETQNSEDLLDLAGIDHLELGGKEELPQHFRQMVSADLFVPANSSLSSWAAYITEGLVLITKEIKQYDYLEAPKNWVRLNSL